MHTFVVRVLVAEDLDGFVGVVEEPVTGLRQPFHDASSLIEWLEAATGHRPLPESPGSDATGAGITDEIQPPRRA
jgi:hypothetical protein